MATNKYPWLHARGSLNWVEYQGDRSVTRIVFQGTGRSGANLINPSGKKSQVRRHVIPADPRTPAQLKQRQHLKNALAAWQGLTEPDKQSWRDKARGKPLTGCMLFISSYKSPPPSGTATSWDNGLTVWDAGTTLWDVKPMTVWDAGATTWDGGSTLWDTAQAKLNLRAHRRRQRSLARSKTHQKRNR